MIRRLPILTALLVLLTLATIRASAPVSAQNTPPEIPAALADLNARTGLALTLNDPNLDEWAWREEIFNDGSLGCPQPDMLYTQAITHGYVITFRLNNQVYDYRAARGSGAAIFCSVTTLPEATVPPAIGGQWEFEMVSGAFNPVLDWSPSGATIAVSGVVESGGAASGAVLLYDPDDLTAQARTIPLDQPIPLLEFVEAAPVTYLAAGSSTGDVALLAVEPTSLNIALMDSAEGIPPVSVNALAIVNASAQPVAQVRIAAAFAVQDDPALRDQWTILIWDALTGTIIATPSPSSPVTALAFSPDGATLAAGGLDGTVTLFAVDSGEALAVLEAAKAEEVVSQNAVDRITAIEYRPDGDLLAVASRNTVKLYAVSGGTISLAQTLTAADPVRAIDFSPDGSLLAVAGGDPSGEIEAANTIQLYDQSGALVTTLSGHTDAVGSVAFSPDGTRLASVSYDGTLRVWELGIAVG